MPIAAYTDSIERTLDWSTFGFFTGNTWIDAGIGAVFCDWILPMISEERL
jgi:hypothetical protein